jgi:hypothetical protein
MFVAQMNSSARGRSCTKNYVKDLAALVVLKKRGMLEALSDAGTAGRVGRAYVIEVFIFLI